MTRFWKYLVLLTALVMVSGAHGAVIYSQTPAINSVSLSDESFDSYTASGFAIGTTDTARSVTWRGLYGDTVPSTDDFTVNFYSDSSGSPGSLLQSFAVGDPFSRVNLGTVGSGSVASRDIFEYTANLGSGITLTSGIDYWVAIINDTSGHSGGYTWAIDFPTAFNSAISDNLGFSWNDVDNREPYFILDNSVVPIPAAVWLFGSAIGLLGWVRRKAA